MSEANEDCTEGFVSLDLLPEQLWPKKLPKGTQYYNLNHSEWIEDYAGVEPDQVCWELAYTGDKTGKSLVRIPDDDSIYG